MKKNETTIMWIIGIVVALLVLAQFFPGGAPFAIAGGGAGSSISQSVGSVVGYLEVGGREVEIATIRPPVGETWLITSYECEGSAYTTVVVKDETTGEMAWLPDEVWPSSIDPGLDAGLRLFMDNNFYLICYEDYFDIPQPDNRIDSFTITGVRV